MTRDRPPLRSRLVPGSVGKEERWGDWFRGTYAMVWYLIGVLAAMLFTLIELKGREGWPWTLPFFEGFILLVAGMWFRVLWGKKQDPLEA